VATAKHLPLVRLDGDDNAARGGGGAASGEDDDTISGVMLTNNITYENYFKFFLLDIVFHTGKYS
jgi:hypothetical protein